MTHIRKPFSASSWEKHNQSAFDFLKSDIESTSNIFGTYYYPILRPEDYDVDVALYRSERAYKSKAPHCLHRIRGQDGMGRTIGSWWISVS